VQKRPYLSASTVYIGNEKDHCSQPRKSRHQMCRPPSSGRILRRACCLPYPASSWRSRPSVALHVCFLTGVTRCWRPRRCSPFHVPIPPASSGVRQEGRPVVPGADARCASPVTLPRTPPGRFGRATADYVDVRRWRWGPVIGRERCRVRPVIAPPPFAPRPAIQLRSRR